MIVWLKCIGYKKCAITENHKFLKEHIVAESQNIEYKERAAVLLFYRNPQRLFTGCYVKIGRNMYISGQLKI